MRRLRLLRPMLAISIDEVPSTFDELVLALQGAPAGLRPVWQSFWCSGMRTSDGVIATGWKICPLCY